MTAAVIYRWNASQQWTQVSAFPSLIARDHWTNSGTTIYAGSDSLGATEGIYASNDLGVTWQLVVAAPVPSKLVAIDRVLYWGTSPTSGIQPVRIDCLPI